MSKELQDQVEGAIKSFDTKMNDFLNKSNEELQNSTKLGKENTEAMKVLNEQAEEIKAGMLELEQKLAEQPGKKSDALSVGEQFVKSEAFEAFKNGSSGKAHFEIQNADIVGSDVTVAPDRRAGIVSGAFRSLRVSEVIPQGSTGSNAVEYTRENVFTNTAAETAEAGTKPESTVTFTLVSAPVRTIAHWIPLSKQVVDDAPLLVSYVNGRMRYGVDLRYDSQLLNGNGTAPNLSGMMDTGNLTAFTPDGTDTIVSVRQAITQAQLADYNPTAVVMNPTDVEGIDLTKDADGAYIAADPRIANSERIWGLPIVTTNAMTAGQFLVGAFDMATEAFVREGTVVEMFEQDSDNVQKNMVTLRAEMRAALGIYRPASLVGGALST